MKSYKDREVKYGSLVQVYRNLHNGKFSIRDKKSKLIVGHSEEVALESPSFIVNESQRQRVLKAKSKNVHAYIEGVLLKSPISNFTPTNEIYYNPYKVSQFMIGSKLASESNVNYAIFKNNKVYESVANKS